MYNIYTMYTGNTGHDLQSLLYNYMNELLFKFSSDAFCTVRADISHFDKENFSITATLYVCRVFLCFYLHDGQRLFILISLLTSPLLYFIQ